MIVVEEELDSGLSNFRLFTGYFCLLWYFCILVAAYSGFFEILFNFRTRPILYKHKDVDNQQQQEEIDEENEFYEGVTILRPIKGIDPELYSCLESSFLQNYPLDKLQILFCIDDESDPSIPIIKKLLSKYPHIDANILISENYNLINKFSDDHYGPNPKVNNLSKGFLAAKYDILWIMDSNVWASSNILKNSVITLNKNLNMNRKMGNYRPVKLVHHVPLAVSIGNLNHNNDIVDLENMELTPTYSSSDESKCESESSGLTNRKTPSPRRVSIHESNDDSKLFKKLGANLDEMFLHTSHAKFYVLLNNLAIAPCVNGKSNMYRRSDLDQSVKLIPYKNSQFFKDTKVKQDAGYYTSLGIGHAIKFFARYIGEDNMIGIALWENCQGRTGLTGDVVVQPLSSTQNNSVNDYIQRRVRWLRVRKYMVLLATLIEPTTESLICGLYGTYAISTVFFNGAWFNKSWFLFHMLIWIITDYVQYYTLINHSLDNSNINYIPTWLKGIPSKNYNFFKWFYIWLIREFLALPIWIIAMIGHEIDWRGKPFVIKKDLTAEEL
ncbi:MAG: hypothetical protein M5E90_02105 [Asgard group archaeon]|nr:hypothetical protein [Asgard group archaeon]